MRTPRLLLRFGVISAILVAGLGLTAGLALAQSIRTRTIADAVRSAEVLADQQPVAFPGGAPSPVTVEDAHLRSEGAQLSLDAGWSAQFRPALVDALVAEVHALALDDTPGTAASAPCVARIAAHNFDGVAQCSRKVLLNLSA